MWTSTKECEHLFAPVVCSRALGNANSVAYFSLMSHVSSWTRYPKAKTAVRGENGDRVTLMCQRGIWVALVGTATHHIEASVSLSLDDVISLVDSLFPPEGWSVTAGEGAKAVMWSRPGWSCVLSEGGDWKVYRPKDGEAPTMVANKAFKSADRARGWVEGRLDRTHTSLRGPRTRAQQRAVFHYPDVRVTEDERKAAVALASRLGVSFSDLARAALKFIEAEVAEGGSITCARVGPQRELQIHLRNA